MALTPELVDRFLEARRAGYVRLTSRRALTPMLDYLRGLGVVRDAPAETPTAVEGVLADYRHYLVRERGLAARHGAAARAGRAPISCWPARAARARVAAA